jgi:twinkle protein
MTSGNALGAIGITAFEKRGISAETVARFGIYTARRADDGSAVPSERGNIVVFPFVDRGAVVNEKYRGPGKKFWQRAGGKRTFWNVDALDDPALETGQMPLIITEGEIDALTAIECGFPLTVSVPDGAPGVPEGEEPEQLEPLDPANEDRGKFEFLWNNRERLAKVRRFVVAADADAPGRRLAAELVRRLSAARCCFIVYPEGCKDLNDVLTKFGPEEVSRTLNEAKPYPVRGLYRLSEFPDLGGLTTYSTGWWPLDKNLRLFPGEFMVVTGVPGHGKSTWVLNLLSNTADLHGWRSAIFSPEMPVVPQLRDKLRRIRLRCPIDEAAKESVRDADAWIERNFVFIDADPTGAHDEDYDLDWLLDRATDAVLRDGVRVLAVDPWNEIEHAKRRDETVTEYVGRSIRAMKRFARLYDVAVIVVAHPTKEIAKEGKSRPPTLYDVESSAHWVNKCDHGVVIDWPDFNVEQSVIRVAKVRFEESGERGQVTMRFDRFSGRYEVLDGSLTGTAA